MPSSFSGGVFSDSLNGGRAGADIQLLPSGIAATCPDGEAFVIPYHGCDVEMGGYNGKMVFCRNADRSLTFFCDDRKFASALSLAALGTLDEQLNVQRKRQRGESRRSFVYSIAFLVSMLVLIVAGYFGIRAGANAAVLTLPTSVDVQIGETAMESMDLGGPQINDEVVVDALQSIVDRLAPAAAVEGMQFRVHVVDSPMVNAFALPGGNMVVYTGLIESAESPEQVAGVLAHEMSHATLRHGLQRIGQSLGIWAGLTLLIGDASGLMGAGADLFQAASINSYSRDHENEADLEGVRMLHAVAIDPAAMAKFFEILEEKHGDLPGIFSWISTHPDHASRIANIRASVGRLPPQDYRTLEIDWAEVKSHAHDHKQKPAQDL